MNHAEVVNTSITRPIATAQSNSNFSSIKDQKIAGTLEIRGLVATNIAFCSILIERNSCGCSPFAFIPPCDRPSAPRVICILSGWSGCRPAIGKHSLLFDPCRAKQQIWVLSATNIYPPSTRITGFRGVFIACGLLLLCRTPSY